MRARGIFVGNLMMENEDLKQNIVQLKETLKKQNEHENLMIENEGLIRGVLIQSCSAGVKNFTKYVFFHVEFNSLVQNSQNYCAISVKFLKNDFLLYKID